MMTEKEFIESQKECADMLGMSLEEYQDYCKNVKVLKDEDDFFDDDNNTLAFFDSLGVDKSTLKVRKD